MYEGSGLDALGSVKLLTVYIHIKNPKVRLKASKYLEMNPIVLHIEYSAFTSIRDVILEWLQKLNERLEEKTEEIKFDTNTKALDSKLYDVYNPENRDTGEPDIDLPSYSKEMPVIEVGQHLLTLVIRSRKKKQTRDMGSTSTIQSIVQPSHNNSTVVLEDESKYDGYMYQEKSTLKQIKEENSDNYLNASNKNTNSVYGEVSYYQPPSNSKCCNCSIF